MVGIGLKAQHQAEILERRPALAFLEVHAENYMGDGGPPHRWLGRIAELYPLSVHGVGLSLGGDQPLDEDHLERLAKVVERYQPILVSEHLSWSGIDELYLNDLLPMPYDEASLRLVAEHVDQVQARLKRRILLENPSSYVRWRDVGMAEPQFLAELSRISGCGILLDLNNIYVSHCNVGLDMGGYLDALPADAIGEIHLAGHLVRDIGGQTLRLDDHGSPICPQVWELYETAVRQFGIKPTLIERDNNIPPLPDLMEETQLAANLQQIGRQRVVVAC
jgi:uncharacterized protein (UPF0276 family)